MATNTTNYNLVKPAYTEAADIAVVNGDMDKIDAALTAQSNGYALIANGNTHVQIAQGQYVYVRNHSSLSEGLYRATSTIQANGTLSTSNLTRDSAGELNYIQNEISTLNSKIWTIKTIDNTTVSQTPKTYSLEDYKTYLVVASHTSGGVEIDIINTYNNRAQLVQLSNGPYCTVTLDGMTLNITAEYGNHLGIICF